MFCLGDLDRAWIEPLMSLDIPRYGVHGNHDPEHVLRELEIEDLHLRRTQLGGGLTVAGFEGCVRYGQREPRTSTRSARPAASPSAYRPPTSCSATARRSASTTIPRTPRTSATRACATGSTTTSPRHILHGHTHPLPGHVLTQYGDTHVHWISGARVLDVH